MAKVEIYTKKTCPYCVRAKQLLDHKKVKYTEIRVDEDSKAVEMMLLRAEGRRTVPQIFINDQGIGGCDDLYALEQTKQLDNLLTT
ncbi:MAG: glutaredoxin 3 [uncultured bacterium]|nr:MAG: glutaredoxin 3 [uncultured bacterium]OGT34618.1 MAG: glutaredoxin 3 [Gammaproteobacteria bacterium RIFCSPHIGHO2_02_FULL_39_13]OGT50039.1 MAG: glutaredoxin 3 [Gammaproteobacteria bacterium RIFCSPHIGHO2_12_FULL_39_24]